MANTIVSLLEDAGNAQKLVRDLTDAGFSRGSVNTITGSSANDIMSTLKRASVPDDAARFYADGVQRGGTLVTLDVEDAEIDRALAVIERYDTIDIDARATQMNTSTGGSAATQGEVAIPVIEEQLSVGKRQVQRGGVRVFNRVTERPVEETVTLREEHVNVERRPVNREVTNADAAALRDGTLEVTTTAEEAVVGKQARVVEEVVVNKETVAREETIRDTVRRTDVEVQETGTDETTRAKRTSSK